LPIWYCCGGDNHLPHTFSRHYICRAHARILLGGGAETYLGAVAPPRRADFVPRPTRTAFFGRTRWRQQSDDAVRPGHCIPAHACPIITCHCRRASAVLPRLQPYLSPPHGYYCRKLPAGMRSCAPSQTAYRHNAAILLLPTGRPLRTRQTCRRGSRGCALGRARTHCRLTRAAASLHVCALRGALTLRRAATPQKTRSCRGYGWYGAVRRTWAHGDAPLAAPRSAHK